MSRRIAVVFVAGHAFPGKSSFRNTGYGERARMVRLEPALLLLDCWRNDPF